VIDILYFARIRERIGQSRESLPLPEGVRCTADLLAFLRRRGEPWASELREGAGVLIAVNQDMARPETAIADGDEIGIFPPVTGG
jgi:molybdopterin synthase sulfur carrier subunit